jgi:pimeloyl-ACP methyl ester carboxylesterase/uncharacterized protein (DUF433 family)
MATRREAEYSDRIAVDPAILVGNPVIRGTRIPVSLILNLLANGGDHAQILEDYPDLAEQDNHSAIAYAAVQEVSLMEGTVNKDQEPVVRTARSRGFTISYEDVGQGAPVILITGLTGSARQMREDGYVDALVATGRRVLNVDPLGHGQSDTPYDWEAYLWPDVAADVIAVLDAAGIDRAPLWGYSHGSNLAYTAAIEYPDRVAALILGGAGDLGSFATLPTLPPFVEVLERGDWETFFSELGVAPSARKRQQFERSDPKAIAAVMTGEFHSTHVADLGRMSIPVLFYCGGQDLPDLHRQTADALGVELHVVGDGDHPGTLDDVESVMPLAIGFLDAVGF